MGAVITIYGSSDDLIEVEGSLKGCDEYNGEEATFVLSGEKGATRVRVTYNGEWMIALAPVEEDRPMLKATVQGHPNGYSACAIIGGVDLVVREAVAE